MLRYIQQVVFCRKRFKLLRFKIIWRKMKMKNKRIMMLGLDGADPVIVRQLIDQGCMPNMKKQDKILLPP